MKEQHLYIAPDVLINDNGRIPSAYRNRIYRLDNSPDRILLSFTGMGMPSITYITQSGPGQPGETILDFALEPRHIQYTHARKGGHSRMNYWDARTDIGSILSPARQLSSVTRFQPGKLRVVRPDGSMREIEAVSEQGPAFEARDPSKWSETTFVESLRFKCPDPTWYDPVLVNAVWVKEIYEGLIFYEDTDYPDNLTFPDNAVFDTEGITATTTVVYAGTWFGYPIFRLTGPLYAPSIENTTLGHKIALNYSIAAGEVVTVDTTYGRKRVYNNFNDDLTGTLTTDSSLRFFLGADPYAIGGTNNLNIGGYGATDGTEIRMSYYTRYLMI